MRFNPLDYTICLQPARRLTDIASWHSHFPFAFALMQMLNPKQLVELGTHKGDSYCAFCQAVDSLGLETVCIAIDTWEGDDQAGHYDWAVFEELKAYHDPLYGRFSTLQKSSFDEAVKMFPDGSINLLHIDGLHTYAGVQHDFQNWLPKMAPGGIVLLHDTQVVKDDFGVWRLWAELKTRYPHFEFHHGFGLGVISVGGIIPDALEPFFTDNDEAAIISSFFARLGECIAQEGTSRQKERESQENRQALIALEAFVQKQEQVLQEKTGELNLLAIHARKLEREVEEKTNEVNLLAEYTRKLEREVEEKTNEVNLLAEYTRKLEREIRK